MKGTKATDNAKSNHVNVGTKRGGIDRYAKIKSKSRHESQNHLLAGFANNPNATAKEVAVKVLNWSREGYCNAQKRAYDLSSDRLAYLEKTGERRCLMSTALSSVYVITPKGMMHLIKKGFEMPKTVAIYDEEGNVANGQTEKNTKAVDVDKMQATNDVAKDKGDGDTTADKVAKTSGPTPKKVKKHAGGMPAGFMSSLNLN